MKCHLQPRVLGDTRSVRSTPRASAWSAASGEWNPTNEPPDDSHSRTAFGDRRDRGTQTGRGENRTYDVLIKRDGLSSLFCRIRDFSFTYESVRYEKDGFPLPGLMRRFFVLTGLLTGIPGRFTYCVKLRRFRRCFCFSMIWVELDSDGRGLPTD